MSLFLWKSDYAIDDGVIDEEHQRLFSMARHVLDLELKQEHVQEFKEIIKSFYDYTQSHFEHEESFMADIHYPGLADHRSKHKEIITEMNHYLSSDTRMSHLLANFKTLAVKWVFEHIMDEDMKIQQYLKTSA